MSDSGWVSNPKLEELIEEYGGLRKCVECRDKFHGLPRHPDSPDEITCDDHLRFDAFTTWRVNIYDYPPNGGDSE